MSASPVLEACAQIIPVLLLTVLLDNRPKSRGLSERPGRRPSREEFAASFRSLTALVVAVIGEAWGLRGISLDDDRDQTAVLWAVGALGLVLVWPHFALHFHMILQRIPPWSWAVWSTGVGLAATVALPWISYSPIEGAPLWVKIVFTLLSGSALVSFLVRLRRGGSVEGMSRAQYSEFDRLRWAETYSSERRTLQGISGSSQ